MKPLITLLVALSALYAVDASGNWSFPPPPTPEEYGNILIDRTSGRKDVKPVSFSHWMHRRKHTCRVCHYELEFQMKTGTTEITDTQHFDNPPGFGLVSTAGYCHVSIAGITPDTYGVRANTPGHYYAHRRTFLD